jgi:hypothetical protein
MTPDEVVKVLEQLNCILADKQWVTEKQHESVESAISFIQGYQELLDREKEWQDMCNKHVGCSMLADEFAGEPHEPEEFGGYVDNLEQQAEDYQKLRERVSVEKIVANVPFYQNIMPVERQEIVKQIVTYLQQPTEH